EGLETARLPDLPLPEGPDSGDSAKECALARTGRAFDEHTVARLNVRVDPGNQRASRGQPQLQVAQLQVVDPKVGNHRRPRASAALFLGEENGLTETGQTIDRGLPTSELGVCPDKPRKRSLHLTEGVGDLHQAAELNRAREIARRA